MNFIRRMWCRFFGHDWRRARKGEANGVQNVALGDVEIGGAIKGPFKVCRRCRITKAITQRAPARAVETAS